MNEQTGEDSLFSDFEPQEPATFSVDTDVEFPENISECLEEHFFRFVVLPAIGMMREQLFTHGEAETESDLFNFAVLYPKIAAMGRDANIAHIISMN